MSELYRFQVDISSKEFDLIEHLTRLAGPTKKDLFCNALALFKWAANERLNGRAIASIDTATNQIRELEMPALAEIATQSPLVSIDELRRRAKESGRPLAEILDELERKK
jgi:hypothetical protein